MDEQKLSNTPPETIRPAWADPLYLLATNDCIITPHQFTLGSPVQILAANPRRWAFGVIPRNDGNSSGSFAPWAEMDNIGWVMSQAIGPQWFTVFEFGPLVSRQWYLVAVPNSVWKVIEIVAS